MDLPDDAGFVEDEYGDFDMPERCETRSRTECGIQFQVGLTRVIFPTRSPRPACPESTGRQPLRVSFCPKSSVRSPDRAVSPACRAQNRARTPVPRQNRMATQTAFPRPRPLRPPRPRRRPLRQLPSPPLRRLRRRLHRPQRRYSPCPQRNLLPRPAPPPRDPATPLPQPLSALSQHLRRRRPRARRLRARSGRRLRRPSLPLR